MYDLTNVLTAMVACTSTFVAIIGGLIANKAISITAEKESVDKQLQQIEVEQTAVEKEITELGEWLEADDAKDFISDNFRALLKGKALSEVYDINDNNRLDYKALLPYWNKMLDAAKKIRCASEEEMNTDGIPKSIANELDVFQYTICAKYAYSMKKGKLHFSEEYSLSNGVVHGVQRYNQNSDKLDELERKKELFSGKKQLLQERYEAINVGQDMQKGMTLFGAVAFFNIILPMFFLLYNPTIDQTWYRREIVISFCTFIIGIVMMIHYIFSLFPKKDRKEQKNE